jgi:hypothetical protein
MKLILTKDQNDNEPGGEVGGGATVRCGIAYYQIIKYLYHFWYIKSFY